MHVKQKHHNTVSSLLNPFQDLHKSFNSDDKDKKVKNEQKGFKTDHGYELIELF